MIYRVIFLLSFSISPLLAADYSVGTSNLNLHDSARNRNIPLKIYYPKTSKTERFPVIVFSHGAGGSKDGYGYLGRYWAEHGFVVLHPTHLGSDRSLLKKGRPLYDLKAIRQMVKDKSNLVNRPKDIQFLLNSLQLLEEQVPSLKGHLDPTSVGVGGHSFGAYTSMAVAGAKIYPSTGEPLDFSDTRLKAFLALSPQGPGGWAFREDSWENIHRPMFVMTGTEDKGFERGEPYQWRIKAYSHLRPGHKYLAVIQGANHMDFSDSQLNGKVRDPRVQDWIQKATLLYWEAYLRGERELQPDLKEGRFPIVKGIKVKAESK
jgi:predicted dienelactone hydrolase